MHAMYEKQIDFLRTNRRRGDLWSLIKSNSVYFVSSKSIFEEQSFVKEKSILGVIKVNRDSFERIQNLIPLCKYDAILFMTMVKGNIQGTAGSNEVVLNSGKLLVADCQRETALECDGEVEIMFFFVPWRHCAQYFSRKNLHGAILDRSDRTRIILNSLLDMASQNMPSATPSFVLDFRLAFLGAVKSGLSATVKPGPAGSKSLRDVIHAYIENNITDVYLNANKLIAKFNISRSNLYRMFEDDGGVKAYIQHRRLLNLYNDLLNNQVDRKNLKYIAQRYGFANSGVAKKLFMKKFGFDPRTPPKEENR